MSAHTPGPWRPEFGNNRASVIAKVEHEVATVHQLRSTNAEEDGNRGVMIANAALIAAAPDLLGALELCVAWMPCAEVRSWPPGFRLRDEALAVARAAIAKARGDK